MLRTELVVDRLREDGLLLQRVRQPSRSFSLGFIRLLYMLHERNTNIANVEDIAGYSFDVRRVASGGNIWGFFRIISPAGNSFSQVQLQGSLVRSDDHGWHGIPGQYVGIQTGAGTTAPTPQDYALEQRISHGQRATDGADVLFENYTTGDNSDYEIYADNWAAQSFIPQVSHRITKIRVKIYKEGSPGDLTVRIRSKNSGDDLATGTIAEGNIPSASPGDWVECTLSSPVDLLRGIEYFVVLNITGGSSANSVHWRYNSSGTYAYGCRYYSSTAGGSWSSSATHDLMFEEHGRSVGEFLYGGTEIYGLSFSDPNGQFTIRRYLTNVNGGSITVNEVGMYSVVFDEYEIDYNRRPHILLIARDKLTTGIAVNNGELLRVTYVPQITV